MDKKKNGIPKLRFPGFTGAWEQYKLKNVLKERNKQKIQSKEYPLVSFTVEKGVTPKTERYDREQLVVGDTKTKKYKTTELNDIVYNPANLKFGAIARNKYGKAVFSPIYVTFEVTESLALPGYIERLVTRTDFVKYALKYQQGTVYERQSVSPKDLLSIKIVLPKIEEQKQINKLFDNIDKTIALHQRKLDHLKEQKTGLLQKMFPKKGEVVPEVRFPGFTDAWEQRKVSHYLKKSSVPGSNGTVAKKLTVKLWGKGIVEKETIMKGSSNTKYYKRNFGQLMYGKLDFLHGAFGIVPRKLDGYESTADSPAFDVVVGDKRFLLETFLRREFYLRNGERANGSRKAKRVHEDVFLNMIISAPKIEEQERIADFLQQCDTLIALHQRKLDHLQLLKKGLLQQMFV